MQMMIIKWLKFHSWQDLPNVPRKHYIPYQGSIVLIYLLSVRACAFSGVGTYLTSLMHYIAPQLSLEQPVLKGKHNNHGKAGQNGKAIIAVIVTNSDKDCKSGSLQLCFVLTLLLRSQIKIHSMIGEKYINLSQSEQVHNGIVIQDRLKTGTTINHGLVPIHGVFLQNNFWALKY